MHATCAVCQLRFEREPGYFIGAIYINYAATAVISITGFLLLDTIFGLSLHTQLLVWGAFCVAFPLLFYRHSKSLWLAIDHLVSPEGPELKVVVRHRV